MRVKLVTPDFRQRRTGASQRIFLPWYWYEGKVSNTGLPPEADRRQPEDLSPLVLT